MRLHRVGAGGGPDWGFPNRRLELGAAALLPLPPLLLATTHRPIMAVRLPSLQAP